MLQQAHKRLITRIASAHNLPTAIVLAMVQVESAGNPWAYRLEPGYRWLWNVRTNAPYRPGVAGAKTAPDDFPGGTFAASPGSNIRVAISANSEWIAQQTSWGLLQVMGANARSYGFSLPLPALCEPQHGIEYGCRLLAQYRDRWLKDHGWRGVVDAYNDGNPKIEHDYDYPDRVAAVSDNAYALLGRKR